MKSSSNIFAQKAINFFTKLQPPPDLPDNIGIMNPYKRKDVREIIKEFFLNYFYDNIKRVFIIGINPGRFGGGVTGIPFTDPIALEEYCGIKNIFDKKPELSSKFVYSLINEFGGAKKFYSKFFISAVFPLALIKDGKNYNYYDSTELYLQLKSFIISSLKKQLNFGSMNDTALCMGRKNYYFLNELNKELKYFKNIITLEHPRYIMQYRLKKKGQYIQKYIKALENCY